MFYDVFIHNNLTYMFRPVLSLVWVWCKPYQLHTSPKLWIKTHIAALVTTPQTLKYFISHNFNNYPFLIYIYIT